MVLNWNTQVTKHRHTNTTAKHMFSLRETLSEYLGPGSWNCRSSDIIHLCFYLFRTVNISTHWDGFWRTIQQTWIWRSLSMKICLDRFVYILKHIYVFFSFTLLIFVIKCSLCHSCAIFHRLTSMNWSQEVQRLLSPMKTRRSTSSKQQSSSPKLKPFFQHLCADELYFEVYFLFCFWQSGDAVAVCEQDTEADDCL